MIYINFPIQDFSMTFDDFNAWRDEQVNHAMQDRYSLLLYYFINNSTGWQMDWSRELFRLM